MGCGASKVSASPRGASYYYTSKAALESAYDAALAAGHGEAEALRRAQELFIAAAEFHVTNHAGSTQTTRTEAASVASGTRVTVARWVFESR